MRWLVGKGKEGRDVRGYVVVHAEFEVGYAEEESDRDDSDGVPAFGRQCLWLVRREGRRTI